MILIKGEIRIPNYLMTSSIKSKFIEKLTYISDAWVEGEVDTFLDYREVGNYFCVPIEALGIVKKLFPDVQIVDKRNNHPNSITNPIPGTVIFSKNKYLLITNDLDTCVDLSTGDLLGSPIEVFDYQILNNVKLVIE